MSMMMSQIWKFVDSSKLKKSKYLRHEIFFLQKKDFAHYIVRSTIITNHLSSEGKISCSSNKCSAKESFCLSDIKD